MTTTHPASAHSIPAQRRLLHVPLSVLPELSSAIVCPTSRKSFTSHPSTGLEKKTGQDKKKINEPPCRPGTSIQLIGPQSPCPRAASDRARAPRHAPHSRSLWISGFVSLASPENREKRAKENDRHREGDDARSIVRHCDRPRLRWELCPAPVVQVVKGPPWSRNLRDVFPRISG